MDAVTKEWGNCVPRCPSLDGVGLAAWGDLEPVCTGWLCLWQATLVWTSVPCCDLGGLYQITRRSFYLLSSNGRLLEELRCPSVSLFLSCYLLQAKVYFSADDNPKVFMFALE